MSSEDRGRAPGRVVANVSKSEAPPSNAGPRPEGLNGKDVHPGGSQARGRGL